MFEVDFPKSILKIIEGSRLQCMHGCTHYKRNPMCPPACSDIDWFRRLLDSYENVKIIYEVIHFTDNIDLIIKRNTFNSSVLRIEQQLKKDGKFFALAFISGACTMCENKACNLEECTRVLVGRTSVCAIGVDLLHLGTKLLYLSNHQVLSFWKASLPRDYFDETIDEYLCLGLVFY